MKKASNYKHNKYTDTQNMFKRHVSFNFCACAIYFENNNSFMLSGSQYAVKIVSVLLIKLFLIMYFLGYSI